MVIYKIIKNYSTKSTAGVASLLEKINETEQIFLSYQLISEATLSMSDSTPLSHFCGNTNCSILKVRRRK